MNSPGTPLSRGWPLCIQEFFGHNTRLPENCVQRPFRHVARVVRDGGVPLGDRVKPDLMRPGGLAVELKSQIFEFLDDRPCT